MKFVLIGVHLRREDVEPVAAALIVPSEDGRSLWLSALKVPHDQPLGDRELLLRVAKIRADLLDRATFIALRYGASVRTEAEGAAKCMTHFDRWRKLLEAHRGEVEMTLKLPAANPQPRPNREDFSSGADYMKALHGATRATDADASFKAAVDEALRPLASSMVWSHRDNASLELAALVGRERIDAVREAGERLRADFPRIPFLLSGPWPLEVFADADHE